MRDPRPGVAWTPTRIATRRKYALYMNSPAWHARKQRWAVEETRTAGRPPSCLACGGGWEDLHHRNYDLLGDENHRDLIPLCRACHERLHAHLDLIPAWRTRPRPQATDALVAHMRHTHQDETRDGRN